MSYKVKNSFSSWMGAYPTIRVQAAGPTAVSANQGDRKLHTRVSHCAEALLMRCIYLRTVRNTSAPRRRREQHEHRRWGLEHGTIRHRYCVRSANRACRIAPTPPAPPSPSPKPRYTAHGPARGCAGVVTLGWGVVFTIETRHAAEVVGCVAELP